MVGQLTAWSQIRGGRAVGGGAEARLAAWSSSAALDAVLAERRASGRRDESRLRQLYRGLC